jgi:hypothetical protein
LANLPNWHGLPIVFTQILPTSTGSLADQMLMAIGDLGQAIQFGMRRDLVIEAFTETFADVDQLITCGPPGYRKIVN